MKRIIINILLLIIPFNVWAYSDYIIPGGNSIGIEVKTDGILVIGFYKVNGSINRNNLKVGDRLLKVNNENIESVDNLIKLIEKHLINDKVNLTINRNGKILQKEITLEKVDGVYKTGLYVKDKIMGIGTLSYIDPITKIYGALGHEIVESTTNQIVEVKTGNIFRCSVSSIDRSITGSAGTKNAKFYSNNIYGNLTKNTIKGIYGIYDKSINEMDTIKVGTFKDIKLGKAYIRTVIEEETIEDFEIEIDRLNNSDTKSIHFKINDERLIDKTGGIVQGMSGSPIIQNNMIVGAVTHVIVDNPVTGYGILITNMLEEGEK